MIDNAAKIEARVAASSDASTVPTRRAHGSLSPPASGRPLLHPLAGIELWRMTRILLEKGGVAPRYWHQIALIYLGGLARAPFCAAERLRVARGVSHVVFEPAPVFIVGHWRSGTTYLHNLLSRDLSFCHPTVLDALRPFEFLSSPFDFISRYLLLRSLPAVRPTGDVPLSLDLPQEDELALATMGAPSFFNCFYFPQAMSRWFSVEVLFQGATPGAVARWRNDLRYYLAKLSIKSDGRRLLLKNPAHSARIPELAAMFPGALFINVHRDPRDVLASTRKLYRTMLAMTALQEFNMAAVERHIEGAYPALMDALLDGIATVPPSRRIDVAYDNLVREPLAVVENVYRHFDFPGPTLRREGIERLIREGVRDPGPIDPGDAIFAQRMDAVVERYRGRLGYRSERQRAEHVTC